VPNTIIVKMIARDVHNFHLEVSQAPSIVLSDKKSVYLRFIFPSTIF